MSPVEEISLCKLPEGVIEAASKDLAEYAVGFVRVEDTPRGQDAVLLGSGTLVSIGSVRAVLTAHHVVSILPTTGRLGLILGPTLHQHTVDTQGVTYLKIARGSIDADGPDLGAVVFAPSIGSAIAARKTFYNLQLRRESLLNSPPDLHDGFWFVNGFVAEKTVEERRMDGYDLVKGFYNLSGAGGPNRTTTEGEHDYLMFPVSYGPRSVAPRSFGGMSGGGLWQVPLTRDAHGQITHKNPLLSGVVFYQDVIAPTSCTVKCHGRYSVYRAAYESIARTEPQPAHRHRC